MDGGMSIEMYRAERDESSTSAELQRLVWEELNREPGLDASNLLVDVRDRVATLAGSVESYPEQVAAERAARRARGLRAVHSRIGVVLPPEAVRSDEDLAREVQQALAIDVLIPHDGLEVAVDGGRVRLAGEVPSGRERRAVEQLVEILIGVRGIDNLITVKATPEPRHLGARVEDALRHDPVLRGDRIHVEVFGDVVIMRGRVRSLAEQEEAEQAAARVVGVRAVRDALEVLG
jgi:osmotically-inducible protein OsmY